MDWRRWNEDLPALPVDRHAAGAVAEAFVPTVRSIVERRKPSPISGQGGGGAPRVGPDGDGGNDMSNMLFNTGERRKLPKRTATPYTIGTGPDGETCETCGHAVLAAAGETAKRYWKCEEAKAAWTCSVNSDIRLKWPACRAWKGKVT